ncbi:MAG: TolB family protein [Planctomycetota bacterium]
MERHDRVRRTIDEHAVPGRESARGARLSIALAAMGVLASGGRAQSTECRVSQLSVSSQGSLGGADSQAAWISTSGRFVAFESAADNLVQSDFNGSLDVFVRDRFSGTIERVSLAPNGAETNGDSRAPSISDDGRYVVFESVATNLVAGDANQKSDVFVRDRTSGETRCISTTPVGAPANGWSYRASIAAGGGHVAFVSRATNLVSPDANGTGADVYVRALGTPDTGACERVSVDSTGASGNFPSERAAISGDGRFVAFASAATNLVEGSPRAGPSRIYVRDRAAGTTVLVSTSTSGEFPNGSCEMPAISRDGNVVAFHSSASDLVESDSNETLDVFVRDVARARTELVSVASTGAQANDVSSHPSLSPDGTQVAFASYATNLGAGADTNGVEDVFLHDRTGGSTRRVSGTSAGQLGNARSTLGTGNRVAEGAVVAFDSLAANLVGAASDTRWDVFVRECLDEAFVPYCFGTKEACPCGNDPGELAGCANSQSETGAVLAASGLPSLGADSFALSVQGTPAFAAVLFIQGDATVNRDLGEPFGDGLRCAGGALLRLGLRGASNGVASFGGGIFGDPLVSVMGALTHADVTHYYQAMYRDSAEFCSAATINFSNGIRVRWIP